MAAAPLQGSIWDLVLQAVPSMAMAVLFAWFALALLREFRTMMGERDAEWREFLRAMTERWRSFLADERTARGEGMARLAEEVKRNREAIAAWNARLEMLAAAHEEMRQHE